MMEVTLFLVGLALLSASVEGTPATLKCPDKCIKPCDVLEMLLPGLRCEPTLPPCSCCEVLLAMKGQPALPRSHPVVQIFGV